MRVLIVDDFADNSSILARMISRCGHEAIVAHDGFTALELAVLYPPDLVLMDIMMPVMDGYETTRRLRSKLGETPPVYGVSATEEDPALRQESGMTGYYRKPLAFSQLRELLEC
jgi:CheY-like chemotaxis protein